MCGGRGHILISAVTQQHVCPVHACVYPRVLQQSAAPGPHSPDHRDAGRETVGLPCWHGAEGSGCCWSLHAMLWGFPGFLQCGMGYFATMPAASLQLLLWTGPPASLGLCWLFLGLRDVEGGGKLSWKQVTCARSVGGMGVAMETASPNSILHPTPRAGSLKQTKTAARQICFIYLFHAVPALKRVTLTRARVRSVEHEGLHTALPVQRKGLGWQKPGGVKGSSAAGRGAPVEGGN